jgi:CheY-like chemotaxis protein
MLTRTLSNDGWTVAVAENGKVALDKLSEKMADLILLDLMMPEMDGFQFATELRHNPEWRHIPVIVLTAKQLTSQDYARLNGDVQRIIAKAGFSREELLDEVRDMIDQQAAAKETATPRG